MQCNNIIMLLNYVFLFGLVLGPNSVSTAICFCSFDLSCPILEKDNFIQNSITVLSCLVK